MATPTALTQAWGQWRTAQSTGFTRRLHQAVEIASLRDADPPLPPYKVKLAV